jgi:replication factor A1
MGFGEKPDYVDVKATITYVRNDPEPWYKSCTSPDCKRKVTEQLGNYYCEKCQRSMAECAYRCVPACFACRRVGVCGCPAAA